MITDINGISRFIMQSYSRFYDGYEFNGVDGAVMGTAVAAMGLPIKQVVNLFDRLDDEEDEAQNEGWVETRDHDGTISCMTKDGRKKVTFDGREVEPSR